MPGSTYFIQECPTCGRNLQIRIVYLGKTVICQHCSAQFEACDPSSSSYPPESSITLLRRAEELLHTAEMGEEDEEHEQEVEVASLRARPR